jgi:hypothetical protein
VECANQLLMTDVKLYFVNNRGCESETDTEEYEKIGQMSIDKKSRSICVQGTPQPDLCDNETCMSVILRADSEMVTDVSTQ